mmetsp:Transcript_86297/g.249242  ORF Transcript_86297/g.249242 Transcript_86297/m.249242 type:complete len:94 (+) Transcript_86297:214-495(+)
MMSPNARCLDHLGQSIDFSNEVMGDESAIVGVIALHGDARAETILLELDLGVDGVGGAEGRLMEDADAAGGMVIKDGPATVLSMRSLSPFRVR